MSKFGELISADVPVLIYFYAQWNEGSKSMQPVIHDVAAAMGDQLRVIKIDVEKNKDLSDALRIKNVPTMMIYRNGAMVWRQTGTLEANALIAISKAL
ncbi:thioredoxin family protein [Flavobacterium sp. JP2137]|uniref:thioredoxin family protein n=1 Tax=Flavobacterium sp. JP2137 TaxID=3414510 RepID=UPI003D300C58